MIKVEIACNGLQSCRNAIKGEADRIELLENLADGGCTPSAGMIKLVKNLPIVCYVMIRPRGGDFCYSNDEIDIMLQDIEECKKANVAGIVFGCLTRTGEVDKVMNQKLLSAWNHGPATFHRAVDKSEDIMRAARNIVDLGFERILSSGGEADAMQGMETLRKMQADIGRHLIVMPGAGVTSQNARQILAYTGCSEIHATCKHSIASATGRFQDQIQVSDAKEVASLVQNVKSIR